MILCVLGAAGETQNLVPVIAELKAGIPGNMLDARRGCFPARIFGGADTMQHPGECQGFLDSVSWRRNRGQPIATMIVFLVVLVA